MDEKRYYLSLFDHGSTITELYKTNANNTTARVMIECPSRDVAVDIRRRLSDPRLANGPMTMMFALAGARLIDFKEALRWLAAQEVAPAVVTRDDAKRARRGL